MATHRLSETEIQMRIIPQQINRWSAPEENLGWKNMHMAAEALRSMALAFDNALAAIEADKDLTPSAIRRKKTELAAKALQEWREFKLLKSALNWADKSAATIEQHMTGLPPAPSDIAGVAVGQEIRSYVSKQKSPIDFAMRHLADPTILGAILNAPSFLSGLSETEQAVIRQKAIKALHPEEQERVAKLRQGQADLNEGYNATRRLLLQRAEVEEDSDGGVRAIASALPLESIVGRSSSVVNVGGQA